MEEQTHPCPKCGALVSKADKFCKNCGGILIEAFSQSPPASVQKAEEVYERKFSLTERLWKLIISPSEAMKDVALAPGYEGIFALFIVDMIAISIAVAIALQKIRLVGSYAGPANSLIGGFMVFAVFLVFVLLLVRWVVKSFIVKSICDSGGRWDFKTAAAITGYAYLPDVIVSVVGIFIMTFVMPAVVVDTSSQSAAQAAMSAYGAQTYWYKLVWTLPASFLGLLWKSYLGSLGVRFGTKGSCSQQMGFTLFFVLGLVGFLLLFVS